MRPMMIQQSDLMRWNFDFRPELWSLKIQSKVAGKDRNTNLH